MSIILPEKLKLRTESLTELTHLELDQNLQFVANSWSPLRKYKEGMIVYVAEEDISITGASTGSIAYALSWWRASIDHGPSVIFDVSQWDPIGAQSVTGEIAVKNDNTSLLPTIAILLDFGNNLEVTMDGSTARIDVTAGVTTPWQLLSRGSEIYYLDEVLIGTSTSWSSDKLQIQGGVWISGSITVGGLVDGVDLASFKSNYNVHEHYISNSTSSLNNLTQISDIVISSLSNNDVLKYNSATQRWVNATESVGIHTLGEHINVSLSTSSVNQFLIYNGSNWVNTTIIPNTSTGLSSPLSHNHDVIYYTHADLATSGGSIINWDNIIGAPTSVPDDEPFLLATAPTGTPLSNYRVLSSDTTINVSDAGSTGNMTISVVDRSNIQQVSIFENSINKGNHSNLDFQNTSTLNFNIVQNTGGDYVTISADVIGLTDALNAIANSTFLTLTNDSYLSSERAITAGLGINFTDSGAGSTFTIAQTDDSVRQKITAALNNTNVGTSHPIINFIESGDTTITVTEDIVNNRYDVTIDSTAPVFTVAGKTGDVTLRINSDIEDVLINPLEFNDGGVLDPGTNGIYPNVLVWDGINLAWRNRPADELFAIANNLSLDSLIDVEVNTTGGPPVDKSLLYFDFATQLWINGLPSDANLYSITELDGGALDMLYYTQTELGTSGAASYVNWDKVFGYPTFALASQIKDYAYELLDVYNYDTGVAPNVGEVLVWQSGGYWKPGVNTSIGGLEDLDDVQYNTGDPVDGQIIKFNSSSNLWEPATDTSSTTFLSLTDTPSSYGLSGANRVVKVNSSATGLEYGLIQDNGTQIGYGAAPQTYCSHYFKMDPGQIYVMKIEADVALENNVPTGLQIDVTGTYTSGNPNGIAIRNLSTGGGNHYGMKIEATGVTPYFNYGIQITAANGVQGNYGIAIADGSEGLGKFLKSVTVQGAANWADITTGDISGLTLATTLALGNTTGGTNIEFGTDSAYFGPVNDARLYIDGGSNLQIFNANGAIQLDPNGDDVIINNAGQLMLNNGAGLYFYNGGSNITILNATATAIRDIYLPDASGTIALDGVLNSIFTEITDGHIDYNGNTIAYLSDVNESAVKEVTSDYDLQSTDKILHCNHNTEITITIPTAQLTVDGREITIKDGTNQAVLNNIIIVGEGGETIEFNVSYTIKGNGNSVTLYFFDNKAFIK
jgi:hypothetical protein